MNELPSLPLRDIHLPEAVSWWPPAYGWWLLALLAAASLCVLLWLARRRSPRARARRVLALALRELDAVEARYRSSGDARAAVAAASVVVRRVALSVAPREQVAALTGERWIAWLRSRCRGGGLAPAATMLTELPYQRQPVLSVPTFLSQCRALVAALPAGAGAA